MAIKTERTKQNPTLTDSGLAGEALTGHEYRFVYLGGASTGSATVNKVSTQGGRVDGVLMPMNDGTTTIASGANVEFATLGVVEVEAGEAFNAGTEVISDTSGRAIAQTGTCHVVGVAREASAGAGHLVSVMLKARYEAS